MYDNDNENINENVNGSENDTVQNEIREQNENTAENVNSDAFSEQESNTAPVSEATPDMPENNEPEISAFEDDIAKIVTEQQPQNVLNREEKSAETREEPQEERSEIVYDVSGGNKNTPPSYNWQYNDTQKVPSKTTEKKKSTPLFKVFALILAAIFVFSFTALTANILLSGYKGESVFSSSDKAEKSSEEKETKPQLVVSQPNSAVVNNGSDANKANYGKGSPKDALSVQDIAKKCLPSSVGILVEIEQSYFGRVYTSTGVGSGFILSEDGYVATNNHVVSGASKVTVVMNDGTSYDAEVVGTDPFCDIAVVKIDAEGLPVAELGNSDDLEVGDLAVAIGTPASIELAGTVTDGIISAVNRKIEITDDYGRVTKTMTLIQTNATINPGNSGGPLINCYGQVIGINTMKLTNQYEGIGFAIPINGAVNIMNQLIDNGEVIDRSDLDDFVTGTPSIGIQCSDVNEASAKYYGIPVGALVVQIDKNSSAYKAGLRRGDIIIKFDGKKVETTDEINEIKETHKPGDTVTLTVSRDDEQLDITFKLDVSNN